MKKGFTTNVSLGLLKANLPIGICAPKKPGVWELSVMACLELYDIPYTIEDHLHERVFDLSQYKTLAFYLGMYHDPNPGIEIDKKIAASFSEGHPRLLIVPNQIALIQLEKVVDQPTTSFIVLDTRALMDLYGRTNQPKPYWELTTGDLPRLKELLQSLEESPF